MNFWRPSLWRMLKFWHKWRSLVGLMETIIACSGEIYNEVLQGGICKIVCVLLLYEKSQVKGNAYIMFEYKVNKKGWRITRIKRKSYDPKTLKCITSETSRCSTVTYTGSHKYFLRWKTGEIVGLFNYLSIYLKTIPSIWNVSFAWDPRNYKIDLKD